MATLYVSPTGSGLRDGSSIQNAGTLSSLNTFIKAAGPGGEVLLLADKGVYQQNTQIGITSGGSDGAPVTIRGIDSAGNPMAAQFSGARSTSWTDGMSQGNELFRLLTGANNLVFEDMSMKNFGNGVFRIGADISNLTIRDMTASNVHRFIEDYKSGTATSATISGLTVEEVTVTGYSRNVIRLQYDTHDVRIDNVVGDSQRVDGGQFVSGIALDGTAHDIVISNTTMMNNFGRGTSSEYWNGDGFVAEGGVYNLRFENTISSGNSDAGYDLKAHNTTLVNAVSANNGRNYRFWSDSITMENSISRNPTYYGGNTTIAHVWFGADAEVTINGLTFSDSSTPKRLFDMTKGGATLHLSNTTIPDAYKSLILLRYGSVIDYLQSEPGSSNTAPTGLTMSGGSVQENALAGTVVASLTALDPDANDSHTFSLVGGATNLFELVGSQIRVKAGAGIDFETQQSHSLTVQVTDQGGLSYTLGVTIGVTDVMDKGTASNDLLTGSANDDQLVGGAGNDTYVVNSAGDVVAENQGEGADMVTTALASYTLGANVESLTYTGTGNFTGTGNTLNNVMNGGGGNDVMRGGSGSDSVNGGSGNDLLYGDDGSDRIRAGDGADTVYGGAQDDNVAGGNGDDKLFGGDGRDYVYGWTGNDLLDGGAGNDRMVGCAGNDTYVVDSTADVVTENAGEGIDTVQSSVSYTLGANVENLTLTGTGAINATGNGESNVLIGNGAANILTGGVGNDILNGGAGNDALTGGQGADTYQFGRGSGADVIANADSDLGADKLVFGAGIAENQLWFARSGNDLTVSVLGSSDRATVQGWYASTGNQLDHFELSDGATLAATQVQQLVDAMSMFVAPPASISDLTLAQQQSVEAVIAANWRSVV